MPEETVAELIAKKFEENMASDPALKQDIAKKIADLMKEGKLSKDAMERVLKQEHENPRT
ncbi:MAG: hypothetical protein HYT88_04130 [Candidatus Omnitrophica bacterium]|nr:hypothetical protein [Candidatus Omnitrophota bacterium]